MAAIPQTPAWRAFSMPKAGHDRAEYEDAFAGDPASGRFAIADGASESSFAGAWADLLVKGYTSQTGSMSHWLSAARESWQQTFQDREFSWYGENKFLEGAYATFLGISFERPELRWRAVAVGDSCLFQMRNGRLLHKFPMHHSSDFGNQPPLIGSRKPPKKIRRLQRTGEWQTHDQFLLMTDALAQWFLQETENRQEPWQEILAVKTQADFETRIIGLRESKELRNDDVTLMIIG